MKILLFSIMSLVLCMPSFANGADNETAVRQAVQAFYTAYDRGFVDGASAFSTEDWNHINPGGGRTNGREAVLKEVVEVHTTFLKGATDAVRDSPAERSPAQASPFSRLHAFQWNGSTTLA